MLRPKQPALLILSTMWHATTARFTGQQSVSYWPASPRGTLGGLRGSSRIPQSTDGSEAHWKLNLPHFSQGHLLQNPSTTCFQETLFIF